MMKTIYVSDKLMKEIKRLRAKGYKINVSKICQDAIRKALA